MVSTAELSPITEDYLKNFLDSMIIISPSLLFQEQTK